jgi:hypothetical protein
MRFTGLFAGFVCIAVVVGTLCPQPVQATVLTFDIRWSGNAAYYGSGFSLVSYFSPANSSSSPPNAIPFYGDHTGGAVQDLGTAYPDGSSHTWYNYDDDGEGFTPNIGVSYSTDGSNPPLLTYDDGFWPRVAELDLKGHFYFTFTPDPGYAVKVNSFLLRSWGSSPPTITSDWTLWSGSVGGTVLASSKTDGQGQAGGPSQSFTLDDISPPFSVATNAGFSSGPLILDVNFAAGTDGYFSLDDLNFEQALPEPASVTLLALGGVLTLRRSRRTASRVAVDVT